MSLFHKKRPVDEAVPDRTWVSAGGYGGQSLRRVPVHVPDDLPQFLLGHLKPGVQGAIVES